MSKSYLYLAGGIILLLIIAGGYLLLSRSNNSASSYIPTNTQSVNPTSAPITTENADESLNQTDANLEAELNQVDQDLKSIQQTSITSQEDLSDLSNL